MFAPDGYVFLEEIMERIRQISAAAYPYFAGRKASETIRLRVAGQREALMEFAENCESLSVASPDGKVMRVSPRILAYREVTDYAGAYTFIDDELGIVDTKRTEAFAKAAEKKLIPYWAEIDANPSSQSNLESQLTELQLASDDARYIKSFQHFNGWAVVCRWDHLPTKPSDFEVFAGLDDAEVYAPSTNEIKALLIELVDKGQRPDKEKFRVSECPSIKRDEFRQIWADAAKERPILSRRGPKPLK